MANALLHSHSTQKSTLKKVFKTTQIPSHLQRETHIILRNVRLKKDD